MKILRKNTGYNSSFNHSTDFVRATRSVNPIADKLVTPRFKTTKRSGEDIHNNNMPLKPINPKPFSYNF